MITSFRLRHLLRDLICLFLLGISLNLMGFESPALSSDLENLVDDLDLTSDQSQTLKNLNQQFQREQLQIRRKIMIRRNELRTLNAEEIRTEKGEEIRRDLQTLLLQARERALFYRQEAYAILTPEQRKKISADSDLGFHCGGWFRRRGRWGRGADSGGSETSP